MSNKWVNVNLKFNADTTSAQTAIQNLQTSLQNIANTKVTVQGGSIDQAAQSAKLLSQHLTAATNAQTGKLDFSALRASLKSANTDLATLSNNLLVMGPKGQQAFSQLSQAIAHADLSIKKTNSTLASFGTTLMNTIKWQASSTLIHGVMSAFSSAVSHIKNLDKALNDIQIVTNKTANDMANFARRAQDLSKALSTTTTEYAKASLIYFQQGLEENDVLRRTEATLKMAKVTGDSVETVSNQLTAIWNNFDNGTQSLEHYADVLTALGAATASSTDEIAQGLQRFAAIAETVGLSYEYAASALATITAETRQSATVVGTALNAIFARMEGLQLGDTLDDGTTLNKYSTALAKAGVNIKDANGDLKNMNSILNQMGEKWQTLNKDQQIALAQTVGGIRQYNQLMALMNNWDTFKLNLEISEESKGTLDEQFKTYQSGVEASEAALKNAKETLYETLFNSKALKDFNNKLADILEMIKRIVDSAGGLNGLLKFGGLVLLKTLLPKLQGFITNITGQISNVIGLTKRNQIKDLDTQSKTQKQIAGVKEQPLSDQTREKIAKHNVRAGHFEDGTIRQRYHQLRAQSTAQNASVQESRDVNNRVVMPKEAQVGVSVDGVTPATSSQMASQIGKESAIYGAQLIDIRKEYLMIEDQLTEKQKVQFQNYVNQIQAEKDLLDVARERQLVSKKQFEENSQKAKAAVELADDDGIRARKAAERTAQAKYKKQYDSYMNLTQKQEDKLNEEEAKLGKPQDNEDEQTKRKRANIQARRQQLNNQRKKYEEAWGPNGQLVQQEADRLETAPEISKKMDFGGERTQQASKSLEVQTARAGMVTQTTLQQVQSAAGMDDGGPAIASIESLEKLGKLQGEYNIGAQTAVDLQTEVGHAIKTITAEGKKSEKSQQATNGALKQTAKFAKNYSKELKAALIDTTKNDAQAEELLKTIMKLDQEGSEVDLEKMTPEQLKTIEAALGKVSGAMTKAGNAAGAMANTMAEDMAKTSGKTREVFTDVSNGARQMTEDAKGAQQQAENTRNAMGEPVPVQPDPFGSVKKGAQELMDGITNLSMGATSLSTGLTMAFDPDATGIERLTSLMMIMQGVMSLMNATQMIYNGILFTTKAVEFLITKGKEKGLKVAAKELIAKLLDTAATTTNAVAKVFNAEASKGLAGIIAGALAAAIIVGTVAMVASTVATNANTQKKQKLAEQDAKNAEEAANLAEKTREEYDSMMELTSAYDDALKTYQETGKGKAELIDATIEVINAFGDERAALALVNEDYALLTETIKKYKQEKATGLITNSQASVSESVAAFKSKADANGNNVGMDITTREGKNALVLDLGGTDNDELALQDWLKVNPDSGWETYDDDELIAYYSTPEEMAMKLKKLQDLKAGVYAIAAEKGYDQSKMELFDRFTEMEDEGEWDSLETVISTADTATDNIIEASKSGIESSTMSMGDVKSYTDYEKARQEMVDLVLEKKGLNIDEDSMTEAQKEEKEALIKAIENNLLSDENVKNYEIQFKAIEGLKDSVAEGSKAISFMEDGGLKKWAEDNDLTMDEALDLYLKINPQYLPDDENALKKALDLIQEKADAQKIIVKYDLISGAKTDLKDQMSAQDWRQWYEKNKDLFDPSSTSYIGKSFQEFASMSYIEQQGMLSAQQGSAVKANEQQKAVAEEELAMLSTDEGKEGFVSVRSRELRQDILNNYSEEQLNALRKHKLTGPNVSDYMQGKDISERSFYSYDAATQEEITQWLQEQFGVDNIEDFWALQENFQAELIGTSEKAEGEYTSKLDALKGQISAYDDEIFLSTLDEADKNITEYDLKAEEVYNISNALSEMALSSDEVADSLAKDADAARKAAVEIARFNKAVDEIEDSYEDWMEALKSGNLSEATKTISELKSMYANLLDMNPSDFTHDFLQSTENLKLAQEAAAGSAEAYNKLQVAGLEALGQKYGDTFDIIVDGLSEIANMDTFDVGETITSGLDETATLLATNYQKIIDIAVNDGKNAQEAVAEANAAIGLAGFAINPADIAFETIEVTSQMPPGIEPVEGNKVLFNGVEMQGISWKKVDDSDTYTYYKTVPVLKNGASFTKKTESFGGKTSKKQSQSGGSKPKKAEKVKKSDIVERYKEINDQLEKRADALNDANKAMDRMYGTSRLQQMQKQNAVIKDEIDLLKQKKAEALKYLKEDRQAIADAAKEAGVTLTFDENGLISNYTEAMTEIYNELDKAINSANADGNASDSEQEKIDLIQKRADDLQSAIDQYDETWAEIDDLDNELDDKFYEWQDNNAEMLSYKLELKLEINDMELEEIEYELSKIEDDFYSMAEAAALMSSSNGKSQLGIYTQELADYTAQQKALEEAYKAGEISQAAYVEGMKEVRSGIYDNLSSLQELDKSMMEYYGNTLDMAAEEIAKYTDRMDHQTAVLDHYSSLLEIMGKSNDYKSMGKVLEGKAKALEDQAAVAKETVEMYKDQAADRLAEYQDALARGDEAAAELYLGQYEAALSAANEAEEAYLSKAEEWAEALKAVLENKLADAGKDLEKALTGGASFDILTTQMERANSLQEEYLTTTNKIYETNKMINTAQQAIDKTTNTVAKQKLKSFQQETAQLQNKGKLSQYELEIQQAKYDLLLAEIALEEAQQAKSTVRLQRDSEGNFGYVYTADASQVSDAEQKLADAQNNLYNIGLEGANNYTQKYQETMREMYDTLTELQTQYLNGEFATEEEYHTAMEEAKAYYYQKLQDYSSLYQVALTTDSRVVADAWSTDFADMTYNTEGWMIAVDEYVDTVGVAFDEWSSQMDTIATDTGADLNSVEENIKDIITESTNLRDTLTGKDGVIAAIDAEATAVAKVTSNYALLRVSMQETIKKYEALGKAATESIKKQQKALAAANNNVTNYSGGSGSAGGSGNAGDGGTGSGNGSTDNSDDRPNVSSTAKVTLYASPGGGSMGKYTLQKGKFKISDHLGYSSSYYNYYVNQDSGLDGYVSNSDYKTLISLDTGGYTGSWGSEGKLAMLHQKELILNAQDTSNFLASLEVLREIMQTIDLHSSYTQISGMLSSPIYRDYNEPQTLEQQVHIEASFPGVQDRNEIEEAFNNLMNRATQFVNRK